MIRVRKPGTPPAILAGAGKRRRGLHSRDFTKARARYLAGHPFEFERLIYADSTVKVALEEAQHGKCCFCESKVKHISSGDVEHFRPKAAVRQSEVTALERPGYYWLAYEWSNLYFSCEQCNRRSKGNLFPLVDPSRRARGHHQARRVTGEQPLFIDPGAEDPEVLIGFRDEVPFPIAGNARAAATIHALNLARAELCERRSELLKKLDIILSLLLGGTWPLPLVAQAASVIADASQDSSEYASAVRCLLRARLGAHVAIPISQYELLQYISRPGGAPP